MLRKFFVYCIVFLGLISTMHSIATASEPPVESVKEALASGQVAFTGRIISIHEIQRESAQIIGEANIQVHNCYYGMDCKNLKNIKIRYIIDTVDERAFPVQFNVSDEILFVLKRPLISDSYFFSSDLERGLDAAFIVGDTFPENINRGSKIRFINIYRNKLIYYEEKEDINKWVRKRAIELDRK